MKNFVFLLVVILLLKSFDPCNPFGLASARHLPDGRTTSRPMNKEPYHHRHVLPVRSSARYVRKENPYTQRNPDSPTRLNFHHRHHHHDHHQHQHLPTLRTCPKFGMSCTFMTPQFAALSMVSEIIARKRHQSAATHMHTLTTMTKTTTTLRGGGSGHVMADGIPSIIPLSSWILPALSCATSYALYNLFIKKSASHDMDPILGGVILQFVAALMGSVLYLGQRLAISAAASASTTSTTKHVVMTMISRKGILWSMAAGFAVGAAELLSFIVSGKGVPATQSIPVIVGGSILMGTILGSLWLQERLSRQGWLGVVFLTVGIVLVGMDPSNTGLGH